MITQRDVSRLADKCLQISEDVKDEKGYVSARKLTNYFDAKLIFRPLLVEAMLAHINNPPSHKHSPSDTNKWAVLVDSEPYPGLSEANFSKEDQNSPLPNRLRFTVAHELAHTLAFRAKEFNVELTFQNTKYSKKEFVEEIERITDTISPLLLVPTSYLDSVFSLKKKDVSINDFLKVKREMSISYQVLVNRIKRLLHDDKFNVFFRSSLNNIAVGVGVWSDTGHATIRRWPLYINFQRGIIPSFLYDLLKGKIRSFSNFIDNPDFVLNGGNTLYSSASVKAGTDNCPTSEDMNILMEVEPVQRRSGAEFLFLIQKIN